MNLIGISIGDSNLVYQTVSQKILLKGGREHHPGRYSPVPLVYMPSQLALSYVSAITWLSFFSLSYRMKIHHLSYPITFRERERAFQLPITQQTTTSGCPANRKKIPSPESPNDTTLWASMGASKAGETKPIGAPPGNLHFFHPKNPRGKCGIRYCFVSFPKTWLSCLHDFWGSNDRKTPFNYRNIDCW